MKRRNFIKYGIAGAAGAFLLRERAAFAVANPVDYFREFTSVLQIPQLSRSIDRFISNNLRGRDIARSVYDTNMYLRSCDFTNFSRSNVFGLGRYFTYATINRDGFNICAPFFGPWESSSGGRITMIEGPTTVGLALAGNDIVHRFSRREAIDMLCPVEAFQRASGTFQGGYDGQDIFRSGNGGETAVDYQKRTRRKGIVRVAHRNGRGLVYNEAFELTFDA